VNKRKYREGVEEWLEREIGMKVNVKEAFKINKDKMMLAKLESWEQKKDIMPNKSKLKEKNVRGCIITYTGCPITCVP
jgi:hypothetical protein